MHEDNLTLHEAFARQANVTPEAIAVWDRGTATTYRELASDASRIAAAILSHGISCGAAIALRGSASRNSIAAMLGISATGGRIVPVDPNYPAERVARMLALASVEVMLDASSESYVASHPGVNLKNHSLLVADLLEIPSASSPVGSGSAEVGPDDVCYVLFTSGSTGAPKGVEVQHGSLTRLCLRPSPIQRSASDCFIAGTILTFDPCMLEIWTPLLVGGSVLCAPPKAISAHERAELFVDPRTTCAVLTPALFALVVDRHLESLGALETLIVGGDVMPVRQARIARSAHPHLKLLNCYGPTENTIVSTVFDLHDWDGESATVPIGRPVAGTTCIVLDERLRPVHQGTVGELYLGGDRLAKGYLDDQGDRFLPERVLPCQGGRLYRTGDLVRLLDDGLLEFVGRADDEIKVRGYRTNPAEVEAVVREQPEVAEAASVVVGRGIDRGVHVVVRLNSVLAPTAAQLREAVAARTAPHLVPASIIVVDALPLADTSKVDREALIALVLNRPSAEGADSPPPDPMGTRRVSETLTQLWTLRTGSAPVTGTDFFSAGGSSLDLIRLIDDVDRELGVRLDFGDLYGLRSVRELEELVSTAQGKES